MSSPKIPEPASELEAEGIPDLDGPLPSKALTGDPQEGVTPPGDTPLAVEDYGVTPAEEAVDEPLAERVRREEPDVLPTADPDVVGAPTSAGRLVDDSGLDVDTLDDVKEAVATERGTDAGAFAPEEAAMRIEESP